LGSLLEGKWFKGFRSVTGRGKGKFSWQVLEPEVQSRASGLTEDIEK
jgi:hypothetical protein